MSKKTLLDTNRYLADPKLRRMMIRAGVISSTAIEGVHIKFVKKAARRKCVKNMQPTLRKP